MSRRPAAALRRLVALKGTYDVGSAAERLVVLRALDRANLDSVHQVRALHEALCFLHAYPDDHAVFSQVQHMLGRFDRRGDLRRHRAALVDSGIAGTDIYYRFGLRTARWLAGRWGDHLSVDWEEVDEEKLARHLTLLAAYAESPGQDEPPLEGRAWLDRLRGRESDAAFLVKRLGALDAAPMVRDHFHAELGLMLKLTPGPDTPSRTRARFPRPQLHLQRGPLRRGRPNLREAIDVPPAAIRSVGPRQGARLIDLAREAMVTRTRDLDAFAGADRRDVRLIDCDGGLEFAWLGVEPEWRLLLEAVYAFLVLQNGVPIGYGLASALAGSSEVAFNVFDTYRGGEAAYAYGRCLGVVRAMFGVDTFTVFPYQLGDGNEEGIESGAWWFYYKLGFRPRDPGVRRLVRRELVRMTNRPSYRSSAATLRQLARGHLFLDLGSTRDDVIGVLPTDRIGLAVTNRIAHQYGSDRERATRESADEAARLLGAGNWRRFPPGERLAWTRLAPVVLLLPGVTRWTLAERRALAAVVRAKGGRRESDFVTRFDAHRRLRRALVALAARV
jgi:hypothetical protein